MMPSSPSTADVSAHKEDNSGRDAEGSARREDNSGHDADVSSRYEDVLKRIDALLEDEGDWIAAMATVAGELQNSFSYFHWTGFYRAVSEELLVIGPYQGGHGCLRIPFSKGVCGAAARTRQTQLVPDVTEFPGHIACSSSTRSEIVVPIETPSGRLLAVLDVDSDDPAAFDETDQHFLEDLAERLGRTYADTSQV